MAKRKYFKKHFESTGGSSDVSANIYNSMIMSKAFNALTKNQRLLYVYMKLQYYSQKKKPYGKTDMFYFNRFMWNDKYKLYKGNANSFAKDRDALIEKGFIKIVDDGSTTRTKNVYQFSSKWQKYGTTAFKLDYSEMSTSLRHTKAK